MPKLVILVTGSNRGIGRELVAQLADSGHTVLLAARRRDAAAEAAEELTAHRPTRTVVPVELDVNNPESVTRAADTVRSRFGSLDILVNNAAIHFDAFQNATDADLGIVAEALQTNLVGTWRVIQAFLPLLRSSDTPRIVNVSSEQASLERMGTGAPAYRTSKTAVNALTRVLAAELVDDGFVVHAASPGWTATDMGGEGGRPIADGAASIRQVIELAADAGTGRFFQDGIELPW